MVVLRRARYFLKELKVTNQSFSLHKVVHQHLVNVDMFAHDTIVKYLINESITKHHHLTMSYVEQNVRVENEHQIVSNKLSNKNRKKTNE
jgi:hypothetical protein